MVSAGEGRWTLNDQNQTTNPCLRLQNSARSDDGCALSHASEVASWRQRSGISPPICGRTLGPCRLFEDKHPG